MRFIAWVALTFCTLGGLGGLGSLAGCKSDEQVENEREKRLRGRRVRSFQRARARDLAHQRRLAGLADAGPGQQKVLVLPAVLDGGVAVAPTADATSDPALGPPTALLGAGPPREPYDGKPDTMRPALVSFKKWDPMSLRQREALAPVVNASVSFTLDLLGRLGRRRENLSVAPWSLWSGLVTLASGATSTTKKELRRLLHLSVEDDNLHKQWKWLTRQHAAGLRRSGVNLRGATRLWVRRDIKLLGAASKRRFGATQAEVQRIDIKADPEKARKAMNVWAGHRTPKGSAPLVATPLVGRGVLHVDVGLLVTSVAGVTGALGTLFAKNGTFNGTFYLPDCKMVQVPMMNSKRLEVYYSTSRDVVLFDIPLRGGAVSLTVLMPKRAEDLAQFQAKLTSAKFRWWFGTLVKTTAKVTLPRLEIGTVRDLSAVFKDLGAKTPFGKGATFGRLAAPGKVSLETVLHRSALILRESGPAAARPRPPSRSRSRLRGSFGRRRLRRVSRAGRHRFGRGTFFADRPFLLFLRHRTTGAILYLARIYNPRPGGRIEKNPSCTPNLGGMRHPSFNRRRRRRFGRFGRNFIRSATVMGGLDTDDVRKAMEPHRGAINKCVTDGQSAKPPLKGTVRVGFTIRSDGSAGEVHMAFQKRSHPGTEACLRKEVRRWKFAKSSAEPTVVGFSVGSYHR
jgi:serine protease inhibitor